MKYIVSHKKKPTYFCLYLRQTSADFNFVFTVRFKHQWDICDSVNFIYLTENAYKHKLFLVLATK